MNVIASALLRLTLAFSITVGFADAALCQIDPYTLRQRSGDVAIRAEIEALQRQRGRHEINAELSDRLMRLSLAASSASRTSFERSVRRVLGERQRLRAQMEENLAGRGFDTAALNSRWLNQAMGAQDPDLRELFIRVHVDQYDFRADLTSSEVSAFGYLGHDLNEELIRRNAAWLRSVLGRIGWFDISRYGAAASQAAWLLVQHADYDPPWQRQVLEALEPRVRAGNMQPSYFAYLIDRVAMNAGEPQTYGTQGHCVGNGKWEPFAVRDQAGLEARRQAVGLESIAAYGVRFQCR